MRVERPQLRVRCRTAVSQLHRQLERAGQPSPRFRVPCVRLQAAHRERPITGLTDHLDERCPHRARLDRVAQRRPRA
eukprot:5784902-Prymnesium_polylepis.1